MPRSATAASWTASAGITLLLAATLLCRLCRLCCLCRLCRLCRLWFLRRLVVVAVFLLVVFLDDAGHVYHEVARGQVHDLHALGVAPGDADAVHGDADHDPLFGDHHQLVIGLHLLEPDDGARLLVALQGDDAAAAAVLDAVLVELGAFAHALLGDGEQRRRAADHHQVHHLVLLVERDAPDAPGRPAHVAHVLLVEAEARPVPRGESEVVAAVGHLHVDELVAFLDVDRPDADRARVPEFGEPGLLHDALLGGEEQELVLGELPHRHERGDALVRLHGDAVHHGFAARGAGGLGDLVHLEPVALPLLREEHHVVVGRGDEQVLDPVVVLGVGGDHALAAAALAPVGGRRETLDVAGVGHGDHHVLFGDQVLDGELALVGDYLVAPLVAEAGRQLG